MKERTVVSASLLCTVFLAAAPLVRADSPPPSPAASERKETLSTIKPMSEDKRVKAEAIDEMMAKGNVFFLDVREPSEIEETGSYEGYVHIPMGQLEARLGELPKDRPILVA